MLLGIVAGFFTKMNWNGNERVVAKVWRSNEPADYAQTAVDEVATREKVEASKATIHGTEATPADRDVAEKQQPRNVKSDDRASIVDQLAAIEAKLAHGRANDEKKIAGALQELTRTVRIDPEARNLALERFLTAPDANLGAMLGSVLAASNDPAIEAAAMKLGREGDTLQQRLAGLELLTQTPSLAPSTRMALMDVLRTETNADEQVTVAVLSALTPRGPETPSEQADVIRTVTPFVNDSHPQIREQGLRTLGEWAPRDHSVLQTLTRATQDPDPSVRVSAVQTLGQMKFGFDDVRDPILTRLQDPQEDLQVRRAALQVLEGLPLDEQTYLAYIEFKQRLL